jgi:hypothetical protein
MAFAPPHAHLQGPISSLPAGPQGSYTDFANTPCRLAIRRIALAVGDDIFDVIPPTASAVSFFATSTLPVLSTCLGLRRRRGSLRASGPQAGMMSTWNTGYILIFVDK